MIQNLYYFYLQIDALTYIMHSVYFVSLQPSICRNPVCANRARFQLDVNKSTFVDFQKVRIQETQAELPRGSIPRSLEVVLRAEAVETAQAGDKCDFIGTLIVVPDVGTLSMPGKLVLIRPLSCLWSARLTNQVPMH